MHRDEDLDLDGPLPPNEADLLADLELESLIEAMAEGDSLVQEVSKRVLLHGLADPEAIVYRQHILQDCLENPSAVRAIYELAVGSVQAERRIWGFASLPESVLYRSVQAMELFVERLRRLRDLAEDNATGVSSEGLTRLFAMLSSELDDEYLERIEAHLEELRFRRGVLVSARLGRGNAGTDYVLRQGTERRLRERLNPRGRSGYSFEVSPRDEGGMRALKDLREKGIALVAEALAASVEHVRSFFELLASELAFYVGCLNLRERLASKGEPTCFPEAAAAGSSELWAEGLYDASLSLHLAERVVGNRIDADGRRLVVITGANQGGKSTFLRALGQAQLMMQSGMFVAAEAFRGEACTGVFTHYKREEDPTMEVGKFEEELGRMGEVAERIRPGGLLLCNESFAATNEREGSEIGRQVVRAMLDSGIKVVLVTHMYDLAHGLYRSGSQESLFLRADRRPDGSRTYKLVVGEPLPTSFGEDTYRRVFGEGGLPHHESRATG
jgi:DNA mismatch repair ATPase MutS